MVPEIKERWIEALLSGKYQQGQGALQPEDKKFCCLGVLCDVMDPSKWQGTEYYGPTDTIEDEDEWGNAYHRENNPFLDGGLSVALMREIDFPAEAQSVLINMNDNNDDPKTFTEIAEYIRTHL